MAEALFKALIRDDEKAYYNKKARKSRGVCGSESRNFRRGVMTTVTERHGGWGEAKISIKSVTYFVYGPLLLLLLNYY